MITALVLATAIALAPAAPVPTDLATVDVSFRTTDGLELGATLFTPRERHGPLPAMLLVHGSGTGGPGYREELRAEAEAFARQGIAVLAPDKRERDYDRFHRDFSQLADDALAAFAVLRDRPEVDPTKAGIWGLSEGGWVAPLAASRSDAIAFVVTAAAPGLSPVVQQSWNVRNKLAFTGVEGSLTTAFPVTWHRMISDAGMFPSPYYDPVATLHDVHQPVLGLWGTRDSAVPSAYSAEAFRAALAAAGNDRFTARFLPDAEHALHQRGPAGERLHELVPGYAEIVGSWVRAVTDGRAPAPRVDPPPVQPRPVSAVDPSASWESAPVQFGAVALFAIAFGGYPLVTLARRVRGRRVPGNWSARVLAGAGAVAALGLVCYLSVLMSAMTEYGVDVGPLLGDRPLVWLALQVAAVAATVATVLLAMRLRGTVDRVRHGVLLAAGVVFVPWALYWGLLLP